MPFSFNSGGQAPQAAGAAGWQAAPVVSPVVVQSTSTSPILFFKEPPGEKSIMAYVQILLFVGCIVSMVVSASMVGYYFYIRSSVASKKLLIDNQEATFKEYPYEDMKKVYDRMMALNILLKDYVTVRSSFRFLESIVENQVLFTQFALNKDDLTGVYTLQLLASTNDYKTLVQQLGAFNLAEYAKIVPSPRVDKITEQKESKEGTIKVQMTAPVNIAGILPEEVIGDSIVDASSSKTPVATTSNQTP